MCVEAWFLATVGSDSSERQQQGLHGLFKGHLISNKHKWLLFWSTPGKATRNTGATCNGESTAHIKGQCGICSLPESSSRDRG